LYFFFEFFVGQLIFKQFKDWVFVLVLDEDFADFLFGLVIQRGFLVVNWLQIILDFVDGCYQVLHS
jgi:hypothetical protein